MSKDGQARVLSDEQFTALLAEIKKHRHSEKNTLLVQISFKLGLRVQEMALLRVKELVDLNPQHPMGYKIKDLLVLPKGFTKGARAMEHSQTQPTRRSVRFTLAEFDEVVKRIIKDSKSGPVNPEDYYPSQKKTGGKARALPIVDTGLIEAIDTYIQDRLLQNPKLKPSHPLIVSQKGGAYSPNSLQRHMATILRNWGGVERASSHSGRRTLATNLLHYQNEHLKTVQQILGHKDASTTVTYHELPESELREVLKKTGADRKKSDVT